MHIPDSQDDNQTPLVLELLLRLQSVTRKILDDVSRELFAIQDTSARQFVVAAFRFIENPTENLQELMDHTRHVGEVLGGYDMQGIALPPAIDAMHAYLLELQCINRIHFVEEKIAQGSPMTEELQGAMAQALGWATILARGYKNGAPLGAVNELRARIGLPG